MSEETVLCPDCGWTGPPATLDDSGDDWACPVCSTDIEFVD
jgi:rubredoxin